jgi:RNA polymerase sigma factor (TIGR02999 family)
MASALAGWDNLRLRCSLKATPMADITRILSAIEEGDPQAAEQLLPLVYDELRKLAAQKMAQEAPGQTLQATALVHEAYIRLVGGGERQHWDSRRHFFAAAAEAMRRVLVESARRKHRLKRGGAILRRDLDEVEVVCEVPRDELHDLDDALAKLAQEAPQKAKLVELRFFAGLSHEEAAHVLGISAATAKRHWRYARAWLHRQMHQGEGASPES